MTHILEGIAWRSTLRVEAWRNSASNPGAVDPRSSYTERFWLPILGPSTTWLLRHLARVLEESPAGAVIDVPETARALGLGERSGRNGPLIRTIERAADFGTITPLGPQRLAVRRLLPLLSARQVARLPLGLRVEHARQVAAQRVASVDPQRARGRRLALSLLELGESVADAELQLARWQYHPAVAAECAAWASAEHRRTRAESGQTVPVQASLRRPTSTSSGALVAIVEPVAEAVDGAGDRGTIEPAPHRR